MKVVVSLLLVFTLVCAEAPPIYAAPRQVLQGTEIHLTLLNGINMASAREGDSFLAVLAQPVAVDSRILLPAGTHVHGVIGTIQRPKHFAVFRGQAYMSLTFKSIEMDSRLIPVQMSLLAIGEPRVNSQSKRRSDVKIVEGEVVEEKHDYKGDALGMAVGAGGGSAIGLVLSNVARGFGIGFAAGAIYVAARKGKEVEMPAQTGMLARLDSTVTLPSVAASNGTAGSTTNSR